MGSVTEYCHQFCDKYKLAGIQWRITAQLSVSGSGADGSEFCDTGYWYCSFICSDPWFYQSKRKRRGKFLDRPDKIHPVCFNAAFSGRCTYDCFSGCSTDMESCRNCRIDGAGCFDADGNYLEDARINGDTVTVDGEVVEDAEVVTEEIVPLGFAASQIAIKQLGTNGGGYYGVNSAHPLENPNWFSNLLEMLFLLLIPASLCFSFGRDVKDKKQGIAVFMAMFLMLIAAMSVVAVNEQSASTVLTENEYVDTSTDGQAGGNMEGKEARFGIGSSVTWATWTTAASNGSVNSMHDSYTPLGGMITMLLMQLGEVVFGGVGCGLYGMLGFAILTVFIAGLMVGRTPEYLGKKIEPYEMKWAVLVCQCHLVKTLSRCIPIRQR